MPNTKTFENEHLKCTIDFEDDSLKLSINGKFKQPVVDAAADDAPHIEFVGAAPPNKMTSTSGSHLPFSSAEQAYFNTPNRGTAKIVDGARFQLDVWLPNAYYVECGTIYIPPTIFIKFGKDKYANITILDEIPFKTLTYHPLRKKHHVWLYSTQFSLPVRSQNSILYSSAYPENYGTYENFFGLKPPL